MQVLKVVAEGLVTSFRYPHFVQGVHPTFEMPPPATIHGHISSAVGRLIAPDETDFAYHFRFETQFEDYEHLHFFGKSPKMNPFRRKLLFRPRLTLYLTNISFEERFKSPQYAVVLGRSQDVMTYTDVRVIELHQSERAFFDGALLSLMESARIGGRAYAVTMPRYLTERRQPTWGQYAVLSASDRPPIYPDDAAFAEPGFAPFWVDPEPDAAHPFISGLQRGILWRRWDEST